MGGRSEGVTDGRRAMNGRGWRVSPKCSVVSPTGDSEQEMHRAVNDVAGLVHDLAPAVKDPATGESDSALG